MAEDSVATTLSTDPEVVMVTGLLLPIIAVGLPAIIGFLVVNGLIGLAVALTVIVGLPVFGILIGVIID